MLITNQESKATEIEEVTAMIGLIIISIIMV